jgi:hypothetical protein
MKEWFNIRHEIPRPQACKKHGLIAVLIESKYENHIMAIFGASLFEILVF